jgi:hypothetical protein
MTLEEAVVEFEARFVEITRVVGFPWDGAHPDCYGRDWSKAPTGETYVAWCTGGVKPQGEPFPVYAKNPDEALELWIEHLPRVRSEDKLRLCWREGPELDNEGEKWVVYSRFAMTDKPFPDWVHHPDAMTRKVT